MSNYQKCLECGADMPNVSNVLNVCPNCGAYEGPHDLVRDENQQALRASHAELIAAIDNLLAYSEGHSDHEFYRNAVCSALAKARAL